MLSAEKIKKLKTSLDKAADNRSFCRNTNCNVKTEDLQEASSLARAYFGAQKKESWKICHKCRSKAAKFEAESKQKIREGGSLFSLKWEPSAGDEVNVIDVDEPVEARPASKEQRTSNRDEEKDPAPMYSVSKSVLEKELNELLKSLDVTMHVNKCKKTLAEDVNTLADGLAEVDLLMSEADKTVFALTKKYNELAISRSSVDNIDINLGVTDIDQNGIVRNTESDTLALNLRQAGIRRIPQEVLDFSNPTPASPQVEHGAKAKAVPRKNALRKGKKRNCENTPPVSSSSPSSSSSGSPPTSSSGSLIVSSAGSQQQQVAARASRKLLFQLPKPQQLVYCMDGNMLNYWSDAKVVNIHTNGPNNSVFTVQISTPNAVKNGRGLTRTLTGRQIAFRKPLREGQLPVGTRVIGKYNDALNTHPALKGKFYAGFVAEAPHDLNKQRYLIFFDDGYAQYTVSEDVIPVVEYSEHVWEDVHLEVKDFTRDYLSRFPNLPMVDAEIEQRFTIELEGQWLKAQVLEIDCSLMMVQYPSCAKMKFEWVYMGSSRIRDVMTRCSSSNSLQSAVCVSKSSTERVVAKIGPLTNAGSDLERPESNGSGSTQKIQIPKNCPSPKVFVSHTCNRNCAFPYIEENFRKISPLAVPFHLGWARQIRGEKLGTVSYVSPCGLLLSRYQEIHQYNRITESNIPIDFFSLDTSIDCLNEFVTDRRIIFLKDISYGKEWTPVQCVNSINQDLPDIVDYLSTREPGEGVVINSDDEFLSCCDCTDDCMDKNKCACFKLTMSGISFQKKPSLQSYEFRRLKNWVESGIYECNKRCKCRANSCLNRVVQNKVKWPVEVFRTANKGWGVRAIHDIPKGSFLCLYTGKLLNDAGATREGLLNGDEYLADLDYIEIMELIKEGYESDCTDIEDEDEMPSSSGNVLTSRAPTRLQVARKSTSGGSGGGTRRQLRSNRADVQGATTQRVSNSKKGTPVIKGKPIPYRQYFGPAEKPYSVDGKSRGNFGRYFNHSCEPNLFIQNVFVDTHDLRFPSIAFFTNTDVKAGTELCWDYRYEVGSVEGKHLECYCGSRRCRKRLL